MGFHLKLLSRTVIQLVRKETVGAPHVTNRGDEYVEQHWRERLPNSQLCVTLQQFFRGEIHFFLNFFARAHKTARVLQISYLTEHCQRDVLMRFCWTQWLRG
jgi:hypothetical protein